MLLKEQTQSTRKRSCATAIFLLLWKQTRGSVTIKQHSNYLKTQSQGFIFLLSSFQMLRTKLERRLTHAKYSNCFLSRLRLLPLSATLSSNIFSKLLIKTISSSRFVVVIQAHGRRGHLTTRAGSSESSSTYVKQPRNTEESYHIRNTSKNDGTLT
jgi:hypothetical protein